MILKNVINRIVPMWTYNVAIHNFDWGRGEKKLTIGIDLFQQGEVKKNSMKLIIVGDET